jgi:GTP-binding protein Era
LPSTGKSGVLHGKNFSIINRRVTLFKSGYVGIIGRPNVGKSTLLNGIIGEEIAISTPKPQTTRNRIMGILNSKEGQAIFLDTPGIHHPDTPLNRYMVETAMNTFAGVDLLLTVIDAEAGFHKDDQFIIDAMGDAKLPVILVINKTDLTEKPMLLPLIDRFRNLFPFAAIIPLSALKKEGLDSLLDEIWKLLPEGPSYFPEDVMTDRTERFIAAEIIREKIIMLTRQEIPYATAVVVESFKEDREKNLLSIAAVIHAEKESQKGILIGSKGATLKRIGTEARLSLEKFFAIRVFLKLFVSVRKDWTKDAKALREFGYVERS